MTDTPKLDYKLNVFRMNQKEKEDKALYVGRIKVSELCTRPTERFKVDYYQRTEGEDHGYQRRPTLKAIENIKLFILKKEQKATIIPTAILASSRDPIEFKENSSGFGTLNIDKPPLYIIDGQHRFEAWKNIMQDAKLKEIWGDYEVPIIILSGYNQVQELEQFFIINSRQKKIKVDLAQRMLLKLGMNEETAKIVPEKDKWMNYALKIVDALNEEIDGVWKNKIKIPGDNIDLQKSQVLWQGAFVASLKPFFSSNTPIFEIPQNMKPDESAKFLNEYWNIINKCYPKTIEFPNDYSVMNTVGVYSLHILLANIIKNEGGGLSVLKDQKAILKKANDKLMAASHPVTGQYNQEFWMSGVSKESRNKKRYAGAYSSGSGHNRLAVGIYMNSDY